MAESLRELREQHSYSTRDLATLSGVDHALIVRVENIGGTLAKLAGPLGVEPSALRRILSDEVRP
jgi:transcriptional regulator with XRE-family HTH domain